MSQEKVVVDPEKCKLRGECVKVCPRKAITQEEGVAVIDYEKCDSDGLCVTVCPEGALSIIDTDNQ
jgi:Fe-S-cluster-containing hydrogenase component 2